VTVTAVDENDCPVTASSRVNVKACSTPENCLHIPNAFTPNSDGNNETIGPVTLGCPITELTFRIYNRWGELVFETSDRSKKWDGYYKGMIQPGGVYIYTCTYVTEDGVKRLQKGAIILIR
jgi:gliding motility-associated-like protein